ncbi:MAG: glycosyltransferase family 4 protein [Bacteroidota bacterium]
MRILQVNNLHYRKGGTESVFLNTIDLLKQKQHEVFAFSLQDSKNTTTNCTDYFPHTNSFTLNRFYSYESVRKIKKLLDNENPEVVHIHNLIGGITYSILPIIKKRRIPVIASIHDFRLLCPVYIFINGKNEICEKCKTGKYYHCLLNNCSPEGIVRSSLLSIESYLRDFFNPFYKLIDQFIFVSRFAKEKFIEFYPELESVSRHIYNFANQFEKHDKPGNYFLYFGRLSREKGLITLLTAFAQLKNINLKIVGEGNLKSVIEQMKTPNVELLGYKSGEELKKIVSGSSFVIVPSECYETLSMTTVESFSLGKPVIGTNLGALTELIEDGKRGFLFIPRDVNSLVKKILEAIKLTNSQYSELSENVFRFSREHFSTDQYYNKLMEIYNKSLSG